jgi:hypothetical protein
MEEHYKMIVNNMVCETLHPENIFAKLYTNKLDYNLLVSDKPNKKIIMDKIMNRKIKMSFN